MDAILQIVTLGGLRILLGDEPLTSLDTRKVEALLVYVACTARPQPREVLADLLWDDLSQQRAQRNLRVTLTSLRKHLASYIDITRKSVALKPDAAIWLDVAELEAELGQVQAGGGVTSQAAAGRVERILDLYQGDFLEGFSVRESRGFEQWMVREQERFHRLVVASLHDLVSYELQEGKYLEGIAHATRLLELDPLMEAAHRQMMQLLAASGRRSEALAQYETCRQLLREELGIEPSSATQDLYGRIRSGRILGPSKAPTVLRGYRLYEQIGSGSFGAVYRAFQPEVGREVAIKVILPQYANQPDFIRRFETEAQIIARLEHPHIVPLYDYWREPDGAYLVMRWLRGGSLGQLSPD
ncbi:MAG: BTAD domain-containing putative transcriptional regulator, partial [Anaerolineales bacterium]